MKMDITFNTYEKQDFCGYANIVFDDKYALEHVQLRRNDNDGLYVVIPGYVNKHGERKEYFHPVSAEARQEFDGALITAYNNAKEGNRKTTITNSQPPMDISLVNTREYYNGMIVGMANVGFANSYMLESIQIRTGQYGEYLNLPKYTQPVLKDGSPVYDDNGYPLKDYRDAFKPITRDAYEQLKNTVLNDYNGKVKTAEISEERSCKL